MSRLQSKELSINQIARIRAHFIFLREDPEEISKSLKIRLGEVQQVLLDNRDSWFKQRDSLSLQEQLTEIDASEIEKTRLVHYLHNVALRKLVEYFENCTPEQAVTMYRQIPALKDMQAIQRIVSMRPTSISQDHTTINTFHKVSSEIASLINKDKTEDAIELTGQNKTSD
jgi:hypothetical protein